MLVYGDHREVADPKQRAREINREIDAVRTMPPGLERHANLVGVLVHAGQLLQGLADAALEQDGGERPAADELTAFLPGVGRAVCRSWDSGFEEIGRLCELPVKEDWPDHVELRLPEGFAFYAVYPEAYVEAARRLKLTAPPRVIGIRSIGTSLAAVVAAALHAPSFATVRPFGDPFNRRIAIERTLEGELLDGEAQFVIVDEGPGQSGSSFAAVAEWLLQRGVPLGRIAVLPSHSGEPGPAASEKNRRLWGKMQRQVGDFDDHWPAVLGRWCAASIDELDKPPLEISGGEWRRLLYAREEDWPAVVPAWEQRKFLVRIGGEPLLVKFAGVGGIGEQKLAMARTLHSEGFVSEPVAFMHGFLIERWCEDAALLEADEKPLAEIARYIAARTKLLPAMRGSGANVDELLTMARRNISLEFGDVALTLQPHERCSSELNRRIVRIRTDNKLDRHEWLRTREGALIKCDAIDHHRAHNLIGCQDVAWDIAGAIVEFDVDQSGAEELIASVEQCAGRKVDRLLLEFYRIAYPSFRLGQMRLGAEMSLDLHERQRLGRAANRYRTQLRNLLESSRSATRLESSVG